MDELIVKISDYVLKQVQKRSILNGFQYTVSHADIQEKFALDIQEEINSLIIQQLGGMEEVADVEEDTDGFDVVLHTAFAPNYCLEDYKIEE